MSRKNKSQSIMNKAVLMLEKNNKVYLPSLAICLYGNDDKESQNKAIRIVGLLRLRKNKKIKYNFKTREYSLS